MIKIRLLGANPVVLNGDVTGRMYVFRWKNDILMVDKRDAISILETPGLQVIH